MGHKDTSYPNNPNINQPFTSAHALLSQISEEAIVGSFQLADGCFLILSISKILHQFNGGKPTHLMNCNFVAGLLEKENQSYLIIEIDQSTHQIYSCPAVSDSANPSTQPQLSLLQSLTERELQIATLIAQGWSNKQTARHLAISEWTVATHLRRIFMKLHVDNRAAMVYKCAGLIQQQLS